MHEFESISDPDEPSQGDVIEWVGSARQRPWQTYGVVVTADCDIAWKKNRGVLSYVPAFLTQDFIWEHWRVEKLGGRVDEYLIKAAKRISSWRERSGSQEAEVSAEAVRVWLSRVDTEGLLDELGVTSAADRNNLALSIAPAHTLLAALACEAPDLDLLARAYRCVNAKAEAAPNALAEDVQRSWGKLPGDVFHLPSMPDWTTERQNSGLFLMLRSIRQVDASQISSRPDDIRSGKAVGKRIARVTAPYRYSITQNLARVFSDIGLPDEHSERCRNAAERFFGTWQPV